MSREQFEQVAVRIEENLRQVHENIVAACMRAGRDPSDVALVAVTKTQSAQAVLAAISAGQLHFGENRFEEALQKIPAINSQVNEKPFWHMIGHIQSRKARYIPQLFDLTHSVDSVKLAHKLSASAMERATRLDILLEINISGEAAKYGFSAHNWKSDVVVYDKLRENMQGIMGLSGLNLRGLMMMAPYVDNMEEARPLFASLVQLRNKLQDACGIILPELSMGMTNDYPVAVEEGATIVRIGRAIFGER